MNRRPEPPTAAARLPRLWHERLQTHGVLLVDGGLASDLEAHGANLNDRLWSARLVLDEPDRVIAAHRRYAEAGADILTTASYQACPDNLRARGLDDAAIAGFYGRAAALARAGAAAAGASCLVAASAGSYGATLADGSEYRGHYGRSRRQLADFHRERLELLATTDVDLVAFETIPCLVEAEAIALALADFELPVWVSFSARDDHRVRSGELLRPCVERIAHAQAVVAVGVNCVAPGFVPSLLADAGSVTDKPLVAYPNAGEHWSDDHGWHGPRAAADAWPQWAERFVAAGAKLVGGCCRTTPEHIGALAHWRDQRVRGTREQS